MRIGVTGTHDLGKSTFIAGFMYYSGKNGISIRFIDEAATLVNVWSFSSREKAQLSILGQQLLSDNYENVAKTDITIIDRIPLDTLVYMWDGFLNDEIDSTLYLLLENFIYWYTKTKYDLIFFLRPDKAVFSNENKRRFEIDEEIYNYLKKMFDEKYVLYGEINNISNNSIKVIEIYNFEYDLKTVFDFINRRGGFNGPSTPCVF